MGEPKSITIHEARQNVDGPLYLRVDDIWYRLTRLGMPQPPLDKTRPVRVVTTDPPDEHTLTAEYCGHDDDRREALTCASRQFRSAGIEDMHAVADAVLELADRYLAWLRGSDG
jgi:hypothetical protein